VTDRIETIEQLVDLYGAPVQRALDKEINHISEHYRAFIEKAPFVVIATSGSGGLDCSPRGDPPGFVRVVDSHTVLIPDRRGNNRLDTLRNIVEDGRISLLFLIPGIGETMRINGRAHLTTDKAICDSFAIQGKSPNSVIVTKVESIYFQCQKALARSRLWQADAQIERTELPSTGEMLAALSSEDFDAQAYDDGYPEHMKKTIY